MKVKVLYFAKLREGVGQSHEEVEINEPTTVSELYSYLTLRHPNLLDPSILAFSINEEYVEATTPLRDGDTVCFIPPVAGG